MLRPLGGPFFVLLAITACTTLWAARVPGGQTLYVAIAAVLWIMALGRCAGQMVAAFRCRPTYQQEVLELKRYWWRSGVALLISVILAVGCTLGLPQRVAFAISRPAMDALVTRASVAPAGAIPDQWAGVYYARDIEVIAQGVRFKLYDAGSIVFGYGFICSEVRPEPNRGIGEEYWHWSGSWYLWRYYAG